MEPARQVIREFRWREILPGLMLVRVFRCSLRLHAIGLSLIAVILMSLGWQVCFALILPEGTEFRPDVPLSPIPGEQDANSKAFVAATYSEPTFYSPRQDWRAFFTAPISREFERFVAPVRILLTQHQNYRLRACWLCGSLWSLLVGGLFAGVICRMAGFDLTTQERYGLFRSFRFVAKKYRSFIGAPLILFITISALLIPLLLLGFIAQHIFAPLAAVLWGFGFAWAILVAVVAIASMFAWPLIWPALATEDSDSFDAIGVSIGYASQRPFAYLGYALAAIFITGCGLFLFSLILDVAASTMRICIGVVVEEPLLSRFFVRQIGESRSSTDAIVDFWSYLLSFLHQAYLFSAFWTSATGIYLLLRYHVDGAELDDIYRDGAEDEKPMPKLAREMGLTGEIASMTSPVAPAAQISAKVD